MSQGLETLLHNCVWDCLSLLQRVPDIGEVYQCIEELFHIRRTEARMESQTFAQNQEEGEGKKARHTLP